MFEDDALQNIPDSEITTILGCLKPLFPLSINAYYFIDCLVKWKKKIPDLNTGILTPKGGYQSGAVFPYYEVFGELWFSTYAWSKEGFEVLKSSMLSTKRFQWKDYKLVVVICLTEEMWAAIEPILEELFKDRRPARVSRDNVYWLPASEVIKFEVKVPEGMKLGELKKEHAQMINNVWPHRSEGSEKLIETMTWVNFGRGLFKPNGELVSWAFYWIMGTLGVVQTADSERRRGYGKVVVQAVCKEMGSLGLDVNLNILEGNTISCLHYLCNLKETEDIFHLLAVGPILKSIRKRFSGKYVISKTELIEILNGINF